MVYLCIAEIFLVLIWKKEVLSGSSKLYTMSWLKGKVTSLYKNLSVSVPNLLIDHSIRLTPLCFVVQTDGGVVDIDTPTREDLVWSGERGKMHTVDKNWILDNILKKIQCNNYRPISLLPCISKVLKEFCLITVKYIVSASGRKFGQDQNWLEWIIILHRMYYLI